MALHDTALFADSLSAEERPLFDQVRGIKGCRVDLYMVSAAPKTS
jgi:hypothetical protein